MSGSSWSRNLAKARSLPGMTWGLPEGPGMPSWELRTRSHRGPVEVRTYQCKMESLIFPCHVVLLALPHVVGLGAAPRVTRGCHTGAASPYYRRGYPCLKVPTVAPGPTSGEVTSLQVGPKPDWRAIFGHLLM